MKQATVYRNNVLAGVLTEDDMGYEFRYDSDYLKAESERDARPVISTHECNLLNLDMIRSDEVWFVEKDKDGASKLVSLAEYKLRENV